MFSRSVIGCIFHHKRSVQSLVTVGAKPFCCEGSRHDLNFRPYTYTWLRHFSSARTLATSEPSTSYQSPPEQESDLAKRKRYRSSSHAMSYIRNLKCPMSFDAKKQEVELEHPGLSYESVDSNGNPKLWSLLHLLVSGRFYVYHSKVTPEGNTFLEYDRMTADHFTFMVSSELHIGRAMYEPSVAKNPMMYKLHVGYVGKTSLSTVAAVQDPTRQHTLLTNTNQVVCVDKKLRRPVPLPDWWRERYAGAATLKEPLRFPVLPAPTNPPPPHYNVTVAWSDTDMYQHTNFTSYVRYSVDAMHFAVGKLGINKLTEEVLQRGVSYVGMTYLGESVAGDLLEVRVWECSDDSVLKVCCNIHKLNDYTGKTIFQCIVKFFDEGPKE